MTANHLLTASLLMLGLISGVGRAWAEPIDVERLATAIFYAEGGVKTAHPYGIMTHYKVTTPRQACINTIRHRLRDYERLKPRGTFIAYLGSFYCPTGVPGLNRLEQRLNGSWVGNVTSIYNRRT